MTRGAIGSLSDCLNHGLQSRLMIDFSSTVFGNSATLVGIGVSLVGLVWAISAAQGARSAARETRDQVARHLQTVDVQRAIGLITRIKILHVNKQIVASYEHYQTLREMLSYVIVRCPKHAVEFQEKLANGRVQIRIMEDYVDKRRHDPDTEFDPSSLNRILNGIQSDLEDLASSLGFGDSQGETN